MATRAVFLDALGTLVELEPPWTHLARALGRAPDERVERAFRAEMAYYREHSERGSDPGSLALLRADCAALLSEALGQEVGVETMMAAIRFRPYADAAPALRGLRRRGLTLICVSNWDVSLSGVLAGAGLAELLDGIVVSASVGVRKPDPEIFRAALSVARCRPEEALHVGDTPGEDIAGARAAAIPALLIRRDGEGRIERDARDRIASLAEIVDHLRP